MTTLGNAPIAPILDRLFRETEATSLPAAFTQATAEERAKLMRAKTGYRDLYAQLKDHALPVSRETGRLLYMLARAASAQNIVEFGTSFGLSTLHLAAALRDNGGGRLIATEFEPSKVARALATFEEAGVSDLIELREGDALETLGEDLPETIDLLLLDGAKGLYADVLSLVERRLRKGALILADNAEFCPDYLAHVRDPAQGYLSVPFADDIELSMRL